MTKSEGRNRRSHNSEHLDIRASDFFCHCSFVIRHSSLVIQRVMQIRFMVPMRAKKASGLSMNSPRAVAGRDSVLDCGSPLPLFLARVGWESARSQGEHTCRKHFFVSFFVGLWLTMQYLEKTSVRGFLLSGTA